MQVTPPSPSKLKQMEKVAAQTEKLKDGLDILKGLLAAIDSPNDKIAEAGEILMGLAQEPRKARLHTSKPTRRAKAFSLSGGMLK